MKHLTHTLLAAAMGAALALPAMAQPAQPAQRDARPQPAQPPVQRPVPQTQQAPQPPRVPAAQRAPQPQQHAPAVQRAPQQHAPAVQRAPQQPQHVHGQRQWRTGERLPSDYRHRQYIVNDWRAHNLPQPPRGQHWVQVDGGYARIVTATGIIMQLFGL